MNQKRMAMALGAQIQQPSRSGHRIKHGIFSSSSFCLSTSLYLKKSSKKLIENGGYL
jgi:hypothetical protein